MKLIIPRLTRTISVTGSKCSISCAHCGKHYLRFMESPDEVLRRGPRRYLSALVSGGMNDRHWVPLEEHIGLLMKLKEWGWRLNLHTGLIPGEAAGKLRGLADVISFDFLTDDHTIEEVYGVKARGAEYVKTLEMLRGNFEVVPHITAGLLGGEMRGEKDALDALVGLGPEKMVFLVLKPTRGTRYQDCAPPALSGVEDLFSHARSLFPGAELSLGCMRPARSDYGLGLEKLALKYDFSKVVMPSAAFRGYLDGQGIVYDIEEECCAL